MPCYSKIQTILIDLPTIEKAAKALGMTVSKRTANRFTVNKGREYVDIERTGEGGKFSTGVYASANYETEIIEPLVMGYAKERMKAQMAKNGYTMSAGTQKNEFVFTSYK